MIQKLQFNAFELNDYVAHPGNKRSTFIPSLSTGSFPQSQASAVSGVINPATEVSANEVPSTPGAEVFGGTLPPIAPIQNQRVAPTAQPAPWVRIPACAAKNFKLPPRLGLYSAMGG